VQTQLLAEPAWNQAFDVLLWQNKVKRMSFGRMVELAVWLVAVDPLKMRNISENQPIQW